MRVKFVKNLVFITGMKVQILSDQDFSPAFPWWLYTCFENSFTTLHALKCLCMRCVWSKTGVFGFTKVASCVSATFIETVTEPLHSTRATGWNSKRIYWNPFYTFALASWRFNFKLISFGVTHPARDAFNWSRAERLKVHAYVSLHSREELLGGTVGVIGLFPPVALVPTRNNPLVFTPKHIQIICL